MSSGNFNSGVRALGGIWVGGGKRDGFSYPSFSGSIYQNHHNYKTSAGFPRKFLGKRTAPKTDSRSSSIPKASEMLTHPQTATVHSSFIPMDNHSHDERCQPHPVSVIKLPCGLRSLSLEEILRLQEAHEGLIEIVGISPEDVKTWEGEHPAVIENDEIRQEYNFLNERFVIKCGTLPTHEALPQFFSSCILSSLTERFGAKQTMSLVRIGTGMTFRNFTGDSCGRSKKVPDAYVKLPAADFPTIVCEAGWSEDHLALMDDVKLWLLHTRGQTRLVIVISFTESHKTSTSEVENKGSRVGDDEPGVEDGGLEVGQEERPENGEPGVGGEPGMRDGGLGGGARNRVSISEEQMVIDSIDETTGFHDLIAKLLDLNHRGKLKKPLVGDLQGKVQVYKTSQDNKDITESFAATLLPRPTSQENGPIEFGIALEDLFGGSVPKGHKPRDEIMFNLEELAEFVTTSMIETEKHRGSDRAVKLLKGAGVWEERETWAQGKRRRLNPEFE
ncbi:hypothetical protein HOY80DRAFT_1024191 [Tuber brumale]|nr:hypothetical protein HOY80DRAFT_1024191 [Tuber brumale]